MATRKIPVISFDTTSLVPQNVLAAAGWEVRTASTASEAKSLLRNHDFCAGLMLFSGACDLPWEAVEEIVLTDKCVEWLALVPSSTLQSPETSRFIRDTFYDFHTYPVDPYRLLAILGHAYGKAALKRQAEPESDADGPQMTGSCAVMREMRQQIHKMQGDDAPVLITGESGTGKELAARAIHLLSSRRQAPFVAVNCGAIPETLVQSELFGYERGAFTGALRRKIGKFESAAGGTILLDEIGDLPLSMQVNLLRFLQEKTIERVGSNRPIPVDVRVIAATNVNLEEAVEKRLFREDLYYRLNVLRLRVPALRERGHDIEILARTFLEEYSNKLGRKGKRFSKNAIRAMYDHPWPGNVRELINRIRRAAVISEGHLITPGDLGLDDPDVAQGAPSLDQVRERAESAAILQSLRRNMNNVSEAARELGVSRVTLYRLINKFHLEQHAS
ncbi:sigma-54 dependent transcriptional regulator [Geomesophilobacter sediminis]|uniref:Sigma-54-dependent Fis family transcriptional regulator n=1 Tax=Geomesophilobacter sediminis TaxID=2798584 RepID=A0A8J7M3A5_9BACT|nr:sigma-54 dependent transcriptional regulator [Geomesophilobacter sediminis]MBJ6727969.1 sigma-54-dependent Fis family transcriptional regulator [Geomesophilobacter sediminis]